MFIKLLLRSNSQATCWKRKLRQRTVTVIVNFMCQLGKVRVPTYLVKYQSRYICEGITEM